MNASAQEQIGNSKELYKMLLQSIGEGLLAADKSGKILFINNATQSLTGLNHEEVYGKNLSQVLNITSEDSTADFEDIISKLLCFDKGGKTRITGEYILTPKRGRRRYISISSSPIKDNEENVNGFVLTFRDVTEEKGKQRYIEYLCYHDQLTGLGNRRFLDEEITRIDKRENLPISVIMADVNGLKMVNDAFGHKMGDQLLKKAAEILSSSCRKGDIVSRLGGDEFIILLPKTTKEEAGRIAKRLNMATSYISVGFVSVSVSYGWETKVRMEENIHDVIKKADNNMYRRKLFEGPDSRERIVNTITQTLYETHPVEGEHSKRVSQLSKLIGRALGLGDKELSELESVGLVHDIGKIAIDKEILRKNESLNPEELNEYKRHPEIGYRILSSVSDMVDVAEFVLAHHENWDGTGYPRGLKGNQIPVQSRIVAIADAYDNMSRSRFSGKIMPMEEIIEIFEKTSGILFDPEIIRVFIYIILQKDI
jgi:diguanylate cyclase (GGDEF)-like protein/PAS domain S-box-containing protein